MSDVSEHDSDSDSEIVRQSTVKVSNEDQSKSNSYTSSEVPTKAVSEDSNDIVNELKKQAENATTFSSSQQEWENYLEQDSETGAYTYTDPTDGTVYEWDPEKRGWIPKIDEDFIAMYQANYGFTAAGDHDPNVNVEPEKPEEKPGLTKTVEKTEKKKEDNKRKNPEWFDADQKTNNNVYVTGLPVETTEDEFVELMSKYGILMQDDHGKNKIKMYHDSEGKFKGDARCCYLKHESVGLAINLLDDSIFNGNTIHIEQAVFQLKGDFDPKLKPKKKKKKKGKGQEKLLDWVDRPKKRSKFDRIVILKNMFSHKEFEKDPTLINDLKADLRSECERFGEIKKVLVFDRNPDGVASILFQEPEMADDCITALNGRFYGGRTIAAEVYDGITDYQVKETEEEEKRRLDEWEKFIATDGNEEDVEQDNSDSNKIVNVEQDSLQA